MRPMWAASTSPPRMDLCGCAAEPVWGVLLWCVSCQCLTSLLGYVSLLALVLTVLILFFLFLINFLVIMKSDTWFWLWACYPDSHHQFFINALIVMDLEVSCYDLGLKGQVPFLMSLPSTCTTLPWLVNPKA